MKTWTGLDWTGLKIGLDFGLDFGLDSNLDWTLDWTQIWTGFVKDTNQVQYPGYNTGIIFIWKHEQDLDASVSDNQGRIQNLERITMINSFSTGEGALGVVLGWRREW
jgi:hypothetical protein